MSGVVHQPEGRCIPLHLLKRNSALEIACRYYVSNYATPWSVRDQRVGPGLEVLPVQNRKWVRFVPFSTKTANARLPGASRLSKRHT
jgi:hypothetical protein